MSLSPNALEGWFQLMSTLARTLDATTRHGIALAVSDANGCDYCLAAHTHVASVLARIPDEEIALNRAGRSRDRKREAAVRFARRLVDTHGNVSDSEFAAVRDAGYGDAKIVEIVALTAQFLLTNYMNNANRTEIDFPTALGRSNLHEESHEA